MGLFGKKKKQESSISNYLDGYSTHKSLAAKITELFGGYSANNDDIYEELLALLIGADIGVEAAEKMMDELKERVNEKFMRSAERITDELCDIIIERYKDKNLLEIKEHTNKLIMMVGVNGAGKTTTISKLVNYFKSEGKTVGLIAADTFRAGAVDQLQRWADRLSVHCITGKENADPASVLVDGCRYYKEHPVDIIIADTAGRLQNKANLMKELEKMVKVTKRELTSNDLDIWLTIDATTGQNGLSQAEMFIESSKVTGVVLTKMDGTSKGGIVLSINDKYKLPVAFMTYGENIEAISPFEIESYARMLIKGN